MYVCITVVIVQITSHPLSVILHVISKCISFIWTVRKPFRLFFVCLCDMHYLWMNVASFPCLIVVVHKQGTPTAPIVNAGFAQACHN